MNIDYINQFVMKMEVSLKSVQRILHFHDDLRLIFENWKCCDNTQRTCNVAKRMITDGILSTNLWCLVMMRVIKLVEREKHHFDIKDKESKWLSICRQTHVSCFTRLFWVGLVLWRRGLMKAKICLFEGSNTGYAINMDYFLRFKVEILDKTEFQKVE